MIRFIIKYRNTLLFALLVATMLVSCLVNQDRLAVQTASVAIPLVQTTAVPSGRLDTLRNQRDETAMNDMAALQALCDASALDKDTREDAAARLKALVDTRQQQSALECALSSSSIAPCLAVITPGCVTIVTDKSDLTAEEQTQALALARIHTGIEPSGVRIICGKE